MSGYTFADPEREVVDYLNAELTETVGVDFPKAAQLPYVQVAWDGTPTIEYPVTERATIRVTCYAAPNASATPDPTKGRTGAKALAGKAQAKMLSFPGSANVYAIHPLTGRLPGRDPDTGLFFCSFTCRVSTVATAVA